MKLAYYIKKISVRVDPELNKWLDGFRNGGIELYPFFSDGDLQDGTDAVMAIGGDGTFLTAAMMLAGREIPILGVNRGRLGFLSENRPEDILDKLVGGKFTIQDREMLSANVTVPGTSGLVTFPGGNFALNEISLLRSAAGMTGIDVALDGSPLPTYWADGVLVSTSSGSTAYNLSAGGPICLPDVKAHIITPVAPHNLNVRPLLAPSSSRITLSSKNPHGDPAQLSFDNRCFTVPQGTVIEIVSAPFVTRVMRMDGANFIHALESKLFWGEDIRNIK